MRLLVEELGKDFSFLQQKMTVGDQDVVVRAVRPHLYKHNNPAGSLKVQIYDDSLVLVAESSLVTVQSITDATDAFFHGYVRFYVDAALKKNNDYYIRLVSSGYTFSEASYIGLCKDFDLRKYEADYSPNAGLNSAFDLEIWELKNVKKGEL